MKICVFGASSPTIDQKYIDAVENMGEFLAARGHSLVFGAGANGLMGAVARGVRKGCGKIYGVIPEFFRDDSIEKIFYDCDELVYTKTMRERKALMEERADAFIVVPGGIGTYEELFEILTLRQLGRLDKTIVLVNLFGFYDGILAAMDSSIDKGFVTPKCRELFTLVSDCKEAVLAAEERKNTPSVSELKRG